MKFRIPPCLAPNDEYLQWAERIGFEPMYTINLGTGDINDAINMVEYTNHTFLKVQVNQLKIKSGE